MRLKRHSESDGATHNVWIESVGDGSAELLADIVGEKFLNVHDGGEILAREPAFTLATVGTANVAGVTSRSVAPCAIVNEQAVSIKGL